MLAICHCLNCGKPLEFNPVEFGEGASALCPHCDRNTQLLTPEQITKQWRNWRETPQTCGIISKRQLTASAALVQFAGVAIAILLWPLGIIPGLFALYIGSKLAVKHTCGNCRNPVASADVRVCPVCRVHLGR